MATTFKAYFIQCVTNLHAGSGDANYGIIDKLVQRDPVTNYPTIHASSLKGGLREHFEKHETLKDNVDTIFGKEGKNGTDSESGSYTFLNADLTALPVRCTHHQFVLAFDDLITTSINKKATTILGNDIFNILADGNFVYGATTNGYAEDIELLHQTYKNPFTFKQELISSYFATINQDSFKELATNLPLIARNKVGKDKNLWYEEIVPHQSIFITFLGTTNQDSEFETALTTNLIQIGGNASVGHGLCKFYPITITK